MEEWRKDSGIRAPTIDREPGPVAFSIERCRDDYSEWNAGSIYPIEQGVQFRLLLLQHPQVLWKRPGLLRRSRSAKNVADEMEALYENGARIFDFKDDDFSMKGRSRSRWIEDLAGELERRSLTDDIILKVSCRIDEIEKEALQRMKEIGLGMVYLGIESGSEDGLKSFNKHYGVDEVRETLQILQATRMGLSTAS